MTLNSHSSSQASSKTKHGPERGDLGEADIEWINEVITKQKVRKAPISIQALRQEMASVHKLNGGHRNRDALASTWHGGSRDASQRNHHSQSSMPKMTTNMSKDEPSRGPTLEELQTIMAAKLSYSKVKELVQDQPSAGPQSSTSSEPISIAPNSLPTVEDLQSLMAQASTKNTDHPTGDDQTNKGVATAEKSEELKDSSRRNKKMLQPKTQDRPKSRTKCKTSLSPVRDSRDHLRTHHDGSTLDPLRTSRHRCTSRSETDPTQQKVALKVVDSGRPTIPEHDIGSSTSIPHVQNDRHDTKTRQVLTVNPSRGRNQHDPQEASSASTGDKRGQHSSSHQRSRGKPVTSGGKDADEINHCSSEILGAKSRTIGGSRGRSRLSSGAESISDRSRRKGRSTSGEKNRQRAKSSDAKRRVTKGTKQEIAALDTKSGDHSMKTRTVALSDVEDNDDVDNLTWMAASIMNFDDDWDNFRPKSTRPVLDANKAKKLAAADDKHRW